MLTARRHAPLFCSAASASPSPRGVTSTAAGYTTPWIRESCLVPGTAGYTNRIHIIQQTYHDRNSCVDREDDVILPKDPKLCVRLVAGMGI
jgi:hypothetical protein